VLYRPPTDGKDRAHAQAVRQITPREVHVEKNVENGVTLDPDGGMDDVGRSVDVSLTWMALYPQETVLIEQGGGGDGLEVQRRP
jgi:hypothetical protein